VKLSLSRIFPKTDRSVFSI